MSADGKSNARLRGVTELPESHGERRFRATIRRGQGRQVNLGVYPNRGLAAFAYHVAAEALHGGRRSPDEAPDLEQPSAEQVRAITARVRERLELGPPAPTPEDQPPDAERLLVLFEIAVVGFWRRQVARQDGPLGRELDLAARRLAEAARLIFWSQSSGHPTPRDAMTNLLARRLDRAFQRADLTRAVLDDDGDDEPRLARWLVYPDELPGGGFRLTIGRLYREEPSADAPRSTSPPWAEVLGIAPPVHTEQVKNAYRLRSKSVHPDTGGNHAAFIRLQSAYEEAQRFCASNGV